jgi:hypothetical protein
MAAPLRPNFGAKGCELYPSRFSAPQPVAAGPPRVGLQSLGAARIFFRVGQIAWNQFTPGSFSRRKEGDKMASIGRHIHRAAVAPATREFMALAAATLCVWLLFVLLAP